MELTFFIKDDLRVTDVKFFFMSVGEEIENRYVR